MVTTMEMIRELPRDAEHIEPGLAQQLMDEVQAWRSSAVAAIWRDRHRRAGGAAHTTAAPPSTGSAELNPCHTTSIREAARAPSVSSSKRRAKPSPGPRNSVKRGIRKC